MREAPSCKQMCRDSVFSLKFPLFGSSLASFSYFTPESLLYNVFLFPFLLFSLAIGSSYFLHYSQTITSRRIKHYAWFSIYRCSSRVIALHWVLNLFVSVCTWFVRAIIAALEIACSAHRYCNVIWSLFPPGALLSMALLLENL